MDRILCLIIGLIAFSITAESSTPWPDAVTKYSGYITVNKTYGSNFFYWFFESRSNPSEDPLILWLTGGPGCSCFMAILTENGPFLMLNGAKAPVYNENSWNNVANILYVDQPVGTGFSYSEHPKGIERNESIIARYLTAFLEQFYEKYRKYARLPLYIMGESFGGHYVPALSAYIINNSPKVRAILKGIGVGNGWVDAKHQYPSYTDFMLEIGYITDVQYDLLNRGRDDCANLINTNAPVATNTCLAYMSLVLATAARNLGRTINLYDVRIPCKTKPAFCYDMSNLATFLNTPEIQTSLGVNRPWVVCSDKVRDTLWGDWIIGMQDGIALSLERGVSVLVYSGKVDYACNYKGGVTWTSEMDWSGKSQFDAKNFTDWEVNGKKVGEFRSFGNFTFLEVENAGHMVPLDQPEVALEMVKLFLTDKPFGLEEERYQELGSIML